MKSNCMSSQATLKHFNIETKCCELCHMNKEGHKVTNGFLSLTFATLCCEQWKAWKKAVE